MYRLPRYDIRPFIHFAVIKEVQVLVQDPINPGNYLAATSIMTGLHVTGLQFLAWFTYESYYMHTARGLNTS